MKTDKNLMLGLLPFVIIAVGGCARPPEISYVLLQMQDPRELRQDASTNPLLPYCDVRSTPQAGNVIIRNQEEYASYLDSLYHPIYQELPEAIVEHPDSFTGSNRTYSAFFNICNVFPEVDFSQTTLLGQYAQGGGCGIDYERHVYRDDEDKRIIYSIEVHE